MAQTMQGHRKSVGIGAVIRFRANDELVGRVIAIKRKRERDALRYEIGVK